MLMQLNTEFHIRRKNWKNISEALLNSAYQYMQSFISEEKIEGKPFNLITFDGMFATKMDSCQKQKRERDAFDIYLGFLGNDINISTVKAIADDDRRIAESLYKFVEYLKVSGAEFDQNVTQFARIDGIAPSKLILQQLDA